MDKAIWTLLDVVLLPQPCEDFQLHFIQRITFYSQSNLENHIRLQGKGNKNSWQSNIMPDLKGIKRNSWNKFKTANRDLTFLSSGVRVQHNVSPYKKFTSKH